MSEPSAPDDLPPPAAAPAAVPADRAPHPGPGSVAALPARGRGVLWLALLVLLALLAGEAWWLNQRLYATQQQIAQRLQQAQTQAIEARTIASQTAQAGRDMSARIAVLQAREQDLTAQREALQQLVQELAKTRDDAFLGQTAELIALAQQQAELTGTLQPLIATLQASLHRLQRSPGARSSVVARAVEQDLTRLKSAVVPDVPVAAQRMNQLEAMIDQLQPLGSAQALQDAPGSGGDASAPAVASAPGPGLRAWLAHWGAAAWAEARQLVTVTRIDHPGVLLASPRQHDYLRANLKLRVLNARLDLLSRNAVGFASDMQDVRRALREQFNPHQPATRMALALASQIAQVDLTAQPAANLQSLIVLANLGLGSD